MQLIFDDLITNIIVSLGCNIFQKKIKPFRKMLNGGYAKYYEFMYRILLIKLHVLCAHFNRFRENEAPLLRHLQIEYLDKMLTCFGRRLDRIQEKIIDTWPQLDSEKSKVLKNYDKIAIDINDIMADGCRIAFLPAQHRVPTHMFSEDIIHCDCVKYKDFWEPGECIKTGILIPKISRRKSI